MKNIWSFCKWIGVVAATAAAPVLASMMVMEDTSDDASARAESIVVAEVVAFTTERTMLVEDPQAAGNQVAGVQFRRQKCVNQYKIKVLEVKKGKENVSPEPMDVRFEWVLFVSADPNTSISQTLPGSGMESEARKGKWLFYLGPEKDEDKARDVIRIDALPMPKEAPANDGKQTANKYDKDGDGKINEAEREALKRDLRKNMQVTNWPEGRRLPVELVPAEEKPKAIEVNPENQKVDPQRRTPVSETEF